MANQRQGIAQGRLGQAQVARADPPLTGKGVVDNTPGSLLVDQDLVEPPPAFGYDAEVGREIYRHAFLRHIAQFVADLPGHVRVDIRLAVAPPRVDANERSGERSGGNEGVSKCSSGWTPYI